MNILDFLFPARTWKREAQVYRDILTRALPPDYEPTVDDPGIEMR